MSSTLTDIIASGAGPAVPRALWELHRDHAPNTTWTLSRAAATRWDPDLLAATLEGAGLVAAGPDRWRRGRTLADLVGAGQRVLIVGLNPSLVAADAGVGFAGATNRFWPAALDAGLVSELRDPLHAFEHHRVSMTDLVKRATPAAKDLRAAEYRHGLWRLEQTVAWLAPALVCVVGLTGWRAAHPASAPQRHAVEGLQPERFGGRPLYLMPNPSGLNAHITRDGLAEHFRCVGVLADAQQ